MHIGLFMVTFKKFLNHLNDNSSKGLLIELGN